jgi:hypothetical protein
MRRLVVCLCSVLLVVGSAGFAGADYVYCIDDYKEVNGRGYNGFILFNDDFEKIEKISWAHTVSPCCGGEEETGNIGYVALTIEADDVDPAGVDSDNVYHSGEDDLVTLENGDNTIPLGFLSQMDVYTEGRPGYTWEEDLSIGGDLTVTTFDSIQIPELLDLDFTRPISVIVDVDYAYGLEVETSTLQVACTNVPIPSALLLLGSGVVGLVGFRSRRGRK